MNKQQLEEIVVKFYKEGYTDIHLTGKRPLAARKDRQTHFFPKSTLPQSK
jgi:Tfp pilus assembly pilus retraction ATPase PilT